MSIFDEVEGVTLSHFVDSEEWLVCMGEYTNTRYRIALRAAVDVGLSGIPPTKPELLRVANSLERLDLKYFTSAINRIFYLCGVPGAVRWTGRDGSTTGTLYHDQLRAHKVRSPHPDSVAAVSGCHSRGAPMAEAAALSRLSTQAVGRMYANLGRTGAAETPADVVDFQAPPSLDLQPVDDRSTRALALVEKHSQPVADERAAYAAENPVEVLPPAIVEQIKPVLRDLVAEELSSMSFVAEVRDDCARRA